jgi:Domain of unknown function (DUF1998)
VAYVPCWPDTSEFSNKKHNDFLCPQVTLRFLGFVRIWRGSGIAFDHVRLFLPDVQFATQAAYVRCVSQGTQLDTTAGSSSHDSCVAAYGALLALPVPLSPGHRHWRSSRAAVRLASELGSRTGGFASHSARACRVAVEARRRCVAAGLPYRDGLHAASHSVLNVLPLFMMANPDDLRAECDNPYSTRYRPERILVYDSHPGGLGLAAKVRGPFGSNVTLHVVWPESVGDDDAEQVACASQRTLNPPRPHVRR